MNEADLKLARKRAQQLINETKIEPTTTQIFAIVDFMLKMILDERNKMAPNWPGRWPIIDQYLNTGEKIKAIKELRDRTGLGLREAKELIERYQQERG